MNKSIKTYQDIAPRLPDGILSLVDLMGPNLDASTSTPMASDFELEIGFGRGRFLIERAQAVPEHRIVGIEVKPKWAFRVHERCERLELANARAYAGDAREILQRIKDSDVLDRVFVHFPDPWWKKRHAKRKVLNSDSLNAIARLLKPGGELYVQTDVEDRANEFFEALAQSQLFDTQWLSANPYHARSNREVRAEEDGLPVWRILAIKRRVTLSN